VSDYFRPLVRTAGKLPKAYPIVAYDFETTNIPTKASDPMTVYPLYLTAFGDGIKLAFELKRSYVLTADAFRILFRACKPNTMLVAYNANRFDLRILLQALLDTEFVVEPYAAKMTGLRGAIVRRGRKRIQLLDPMAMLGLETSLRSFLETFAPAYPKGEIDFEAGEFDPNNPDHRAYAMRDSEALYYGMTKAAELVADLVGERLRPTIGSLAIRAFVRNMPRDARVPHLRPETYEIVRKVVMRGGYVVARRYQGPLWTYDLNQAYADAMRATWLPSGMALPVKEFVRDRPGFYYCTLGRAERSPIPFVIREPYAPFRMREIYGDESDRTTESLAREMWLEALEHYERDAIPEKVVTPDWVWNGHVWKVALEFADVPGRYLDLRNKPKDPPFHRIATTVVGNADDVATQFGFPGLDAFLERLCNTKTRPTLAAFLPDAERRLKAEPPSGVSTWIVDEEIETLRDLGWTVQISGGYAFQSRFKMTEWVNQLEAARATYEKNDPRNMLLKKVGCNAYGKTLQEPQAWKTVLSRDMPAGAHPCVEPDEWGTPLFGFWIVPEKKDTRRQFMRPQLGAFITAHVRCRIYRAAMRDPDYFVKADTDSVSFAREQSWPDLDPHRYGAWKCEASGDYTIVVAKKVSWSAAKTTAKGMRTKTLTQSDFERWIAGQVPVQEQIQLQSWRKGNLAPTWKPQARSGTAVDAGELPWCPGRKHGV
jgi:hypothetical protein